MLKTLKDGRTRTKPRFSGDPSTSASLMWVLLPSLASCYQQFGCPPRNGGSGGPLAHRNTTFFWHLIKKKKQFFGFLSAILNASCHPHIVMQYLWPAKTPKHRRMLLGGENTPDRQHKYRISAPPWRKTEIAAPVSLFLLWLGASKNIPILILSLNISACPTNLNFSVRKDAASRMVMEYYGMFY